MEGRLADSSHPLIVDALRRAAADPAGLPLHGGRARSGLFPGSLAAKKAAGLCKDRQFLHVLRTEQHGKGPVEICTITEQGLAYLVTQTSPQEVLGHLVRALDEGTREIDTLLAAAEQTRHRLEQLRAAIARVEQSIGAPGGNGTPHCNGAPRPAEPAWIPAMLAALAQWRAAHPTADCPLPELYRMANATGPVSVGTFHDGLRQLRAEGRLELHPWTAPLHEMPEPLLALLVGHSVVYYASHK